MNKPRKQKREGLTKRLERIAYNVANDAEEAMEGIKRVGMYDLSPSVKVIHKALLRVSKLSAPVPLKAGKRRGK